jgi:nitroreductase
MLLDLLKRRCSVRNFLDKEISPEIITYMVLAALEYGIGSTWISYFKVKEIAELLNLPEGVIPAEMIAFGYPAGEMKPVSKKNVQELVFYNSEYEKANEVQPRQI